VPSSRKGWTTDRFAKQEIQAIETFVDQELAGDP
jgi:hypothetical protein